MVNENIRQQVRLVKRLTKRVLNPFPANIVNNLQRNSAGLSILQYLNPRLVLMEFHPFLVQDKSILTEQINSLAAKDKPAAPAATEYTFSGTLESDASTLSRNAKAVSSSIPDTFNLEKKIHDVNAMNLGYLTQLVTEIEESQDQRLTHDSTSKRPDSVKSNSTVRDAFTERPRLKENHGLRSKAVSSVKQTVSADFNNHIKASSALIRDSAQSNRSNTLRNKGEAQRVQPTLDVAITALTAINNLVKTLDEWEVNHHLKKSKLNVNNRALRFLQSNHPGSTLESLASSLLSESANLEASKNYENNSYASRSGSQNPVVKNKRGTLHTLNAVNEEVHISRIVDKMSDVKTVLNTGSGVASASSGFYPLSHHVTPEIVAQNTLSNFMARSPVRDTFDQDLSFQSMTQFDTQKMADALSEYLQEQASLHGFDSI